MPYTKPKIATARALTAFVARKSLSLATALYLIVVAVLIAAIWLLAHYLSAWWWVLMTPLVAVTLVVFVVRMIILFIIKKIYRHPFTRMQREKLEEFTRRVISLAEVRSTPLPFYALITIWDVVRRRDVTTIRKLIGDSRSLRSDYAALENYFGER